LSIKDRAAAVRRLINDEIVQEVLQEIREEQVNVFLSTATFPEDRESAHDIIVALNKIEDKFQGILAAEAIHDKREEKRTSAPWASTETQVNDGTIESAIAKLIQPESQSNRVEDADYEEEDQDEPEQEPEESEEDYEGEDEEDTEEEYEEGSTPELYTVKVDGKEEQVSLEDLKRGYSGQKYVQKGMQEVAQIRRQAEETYAALMAARQQTDQLLQVAQSGHLMTPPFPPDRSKFDSDPIGYMEEKLNYDEQMKQYQNQSVQVQQILQQQSYAEQQAQQVYLQRELEALRTNVPEFADPKTR
jgi:hypothetical protein